MFRPHCLTNAARVAKFASWMIFSGSSAVGSDGSLNHRWGRMANVRDTSNALWRHAASRARPLLPRSGRYRLGRTERPSILLDCVLLGAPREDFRRFKVATSYAAGRGRASSRPFELIIAGRLKHDRHRSILITGAATSISDGFLPPEATDPEIPVQTRVCLARHYHPYDL